MTRPSGKPVASLPLTTRRWQCARDLRSIRAEFEDQIRALWEDFHVMRSPSRSLSSILGSFLAPTSYKTLSKAGLSTALNRIERHTAREAVAVLLFSRVDFYLNRSVQKVREFFPAGPAVKGKSCPACGKPGPKWQPHRPNFGKPFFVEDLAQVGLHDWDVPPLSTLDCFAHQKGRRRPIAGGHGRVVWDDPKMIDAFKTCEDLYQRASRQIEKAVKKHA